MWESGTCSSTWTYTTSSTATHRSRSSAPTTPTGDILHRSSMDGWSSSARNSISREEIANEEKYANWLGSTRDLMCDRGTSRPGSGSGHEPERFRAERSREPCRPGRQADLLVELTRAPRPDSDRGD